MPATRTAAAAGLAHYTTRTDQAKDTGQVDIGPHYIAAFQPTASSVAAIDTDGDGIADYLEDASGDGATAGARKATGPTWRTSASESGSPIPNPLPAFPESTHPISFIRSSMKTLFKPFALGMLSLALSGPLLAVDTPADLARRVEYSSVFRSPIRYLGADVPAAADSEAVLASFKAFDGGAEAGKAALEAFLTSAT
jgi:hypothetical protein